MDKQKRADIEHHSKNIQKTKTALEKLNKNFTLENEKIASYEKDIPIKEQTLVSLQDKKEALEKYINDKEDEILRKTETLQKKKTEIEKQLQPYLDKINNSKHLIEQNNNTINMMSQNNKKKNSEFEATKVNYENISSLILTKQNQLNDIEKSIETLKESLKKEKKNVETLIHEYDSKSKELLLMQQKLSEVKSSNQEFTQRNQMIEKLLKAQSEGQLSGIYGRLGDLGAIDQKYDIAATTSCNRLNNIVVETADQGSKCIEFLRKNRLGRGDFIVLEKVQYSMDPFLTKSFKAPNQTERIFDLIKIQNKKLIPAFYFAFRDTLVCDDIKTAQLVGYGSTRHRIVTLIGELIEVSGVMSGGGKPSRGGMSNKIANDVNPEEVNKLSNDFNNLSKELDQLRSQKQLAENTIQNINRQLIESVNISKRLENELDQLDKSKRDIEKVFNVLKKDESKLQAVNEEIEKLGKVNLDLEKSVKQDEEESTGIKKDFENILVEINKISGSDFIGKVIIFLNKPQLK